VARAARARAAAALAATSLLAALPLEASDSYTWRLPPGFPQPAVPANNPMSDAKVALGRRLFFDPLLSVNGRYSCASCHDPQRSFSDGRAVAIGATGEPLPHNALALVNVAYNLSFGWSRPEVRSLESQMLEPMLNRHPLELGLAGRQASVCATLAADPQYAGAFAAAFPQPSPQRANGAVTFDHLVKAIAAFERTLISGRSPFDRYVFSGEHAALSEEAKRGMALFFSPTIGCAQCHAGFNFAGNWRDAQGATGRASFANNGTSAAPLRVPTLRNIALTAPYMHDGRFGSLEEVIGHYSRLGEQAQAHRGRQDPRLPRRPLASAERADLIAFLRSLTDEAFVQRFAAAGGGPGASGGSPAAEPRTTTEN
jgi:cytochrome c peroxidase